MNELLWLSVGFLSAGLLCWFIYNQRSVALRNHLNEALERCASFDSERTQLLEGHEREILRIVEEWRGYSNKTIADFAAQKDAEIAALRNEICPFVVQLKPLVFRQPGGWLTFGRNKIRLGYEIACFAEQNPIGTPQIIFLKELSIKISTKDDVGELLQEALRITRAYYDQQGENTQRYIQLIPARFIE